MAGAIQLTEVDFDQIKTNLIDYLKSTRQFTDYDFSGSNLSVILNLIAYQAQLNAYSTNMIANESFLASASIRDNVVANARSIGYVPASAKSAFSYVDFTFQLDSERFTEGFPQFLTINPGMCFSTAGGNQNFVFNITDPETSAVSNDGECRFINVKVNEGVYLNASFVVDESNFNQRFVIRNKDIDTTTIRVEVQENPQQDERKFYSQANNLVTIGQESRVYWLEEVDESYYELTFGDGYFGKKLQNGARIFVTYIVSNGPLANGIHGETNYSFVGDLIDTTGAAVSGVKPTVASASVTEGGADIETTSSIKFRAPREYAAQARTVTTEDYETLVRRIYPAVEDIYVIGGENMPIPQFGRVFIVIKPKTGNALSQIAKNFIKKSLDPFRVASLDIQFMDPDILNVEVVSAVYFDEKRTIKDQSAIIASVKQTLERYVDSQAVPRFGGAIRYSKIVGAIDDSDESITRNNTFLRLRKDVLAIKDTSATYEICFEEQIKVNSEEEELTTDLQSVVYSSGFEVEVEGVPDPRVFYFEDDPKTREFIRNEDGEITHILAKIRSFYFDRNNNKIIDDKEFGEVDYFSGEVRIGYSRPITITNTVLPRNIIEVRAIPKDSDIIAKMITFLELDVSKSDIVAIIDTEIAGS